MKNKKQKLVGELQSLLKKVSAIREQIEEIDYSERFSKASKYVGKCYSLSDEYIHSIFIYGINKDTCRLESLSIHDFSNGEGNNFSIEQYTLFMDSPEEDKDYIYKEISKQQFDEQFNIIQKEIQKVYETNDTSFKQLKPFMPSNVKSKRSRRNRT